jgi:hypothetical protein
MNSNSSNESSKQSVHAGRDAIQVGRDYTSTKTNNYFFTFFIIWILAFGGLAWGLYTGVIQNPTLTNPSQPQTSPASTK